MVIIKIRLISFLIIISTIILIDLIFFQVAMPADNEQIIIGENLKPGMSLKDAIKLIGPPERIKTGNNGTIVMPYDTLGISIEVMNDGDTIDKIHVNSSFKGRFASGIGIGDDFQKILSVYNQPDMMTKEIIEYSKPSIIFQINEGKLTGADFNSVANTSNQTVSSKDTEKNQEVIKPVNTEEDKEVKEEVREALRDEMREEVRAELLEEINKELNEDFDVFALYGFKVKINSGSVIISEIEPGSAAEKGGLKIGAPIRKAFYEGAGINNIYYVKGLEAVLKRAVVKHKKVINILQAENYYHKVEVPKRK